VTRILSFLGFTANIINLSGFPHHTLKKIILICNLQSRVYDSLSEFYSQTFLRRPRLPKPFRFISTDFSCFFLSIQGTARLQVPLAQASGTLFFTRQ
jgi:hypothetical protein